VAENIAVAGDDVDLSRRKFLTSATIGVVDVGTVLAAVPFVASWQPSERARALGVPTELDLSKVDAGQMVIILWRKQPIYVVRRTPEMVSSLPGHEDQLKDPKSENSEQPDYARNAMRSRTPEILVLIGICTHLGCLPKQHFAAGDPELGPTWPGGYLCPCHGSRFDLAGRVFDGSPASVNLQIPPYSFPKQNRLVVGVDEKGEA
jgi:ubiquinol-cytochrome c reductase iron-sulfur subunit